MPRTTNANILISYFAKDGAIRINDDGSVKIIANKRGVASSLDEKGRQGSGNLTHINKLAKTYSSLHEEGSYIRTGVEFKSKGKEKAALLELSDTPSFKENGKLVLSGQLVGKIKPDTDAIDHTDFTGKEFSAKNNASHLRQGKYKIKNTDITLDTYSFDELESHIAGTSLQTIHYFEKKDIRLSLNRSALEPIAGQLPPPDTHEELSFNLVDFNHTYQLEGTSAQLNIQARVTPSIDTQFNTPDHWWSYLNPSAYSLDVNLVLQWDGQAEFITGSDSGSFSLGSISIPGPSFGAGEIPFVANLTSGLDLASSVNLNGLNDSYTFSASQALGLNTTIRTDGVTTQNTSTGVNTQAPSFDEITGLKLDASATPWVNLSVGLSVPESVPYYGGDSLASVNGKASIPLTFKLDTSPMNATIGVAGEFDATANFLTFLSNGGYSFPLFSGSFFDWTSPNLIG